MIKLTQKGLKLQVDAAHIPEKMFAVTGLTPEKLNEITLQLDQLIAYISE
jgi:hypothetical protein